MKQQADLTDFVIIAFIAVIFIIGAIAVFKFMRAGKK
jgi:hypothetical protein